MVSEDSDTLRLSASRSIAPLFSSLELDWKEASPAELQQRIADGTSLLSGLEIEFGESII